jgi:hypothetical protein
MGDYLQELDDMITTARRWRDVAQGPVIRIDLTPEQEAEVAGIIKGLTGAKEIYESFQEEAHEDSQ